MGLMSDGFCIFNFSYLSLTSLSLRQCKEKECMVILKNRFPFAVRLLGLI